jgi:hypothetical protein
MAVNEKDSIGMLRRRNSVEQRNGRAGARRIEFIELTHPWGSAGAIALWVLNRFFYVKGLDNRAPQ